MLTDKQIKNLEMTLGDQGIFSYLHKRSRLLPDFLREINIETIKALLRLKEKRGENA